LLLVLDKREWLIAGWTYSQSGCKRLIGKFPTSPVIDTCLTGKDPEVEENDRQMGSSAYRCFCLLQIKVIHRTQGFCRISPVRLVVGTGYAVPRDRGAWSLGKAGLHNCLSDIRFFRE
jgi:hypothetical protein